MSTANTVHPKNKFPCDVATELGYLQACERTAETPKAGLTAYRTWCLARVCGWDTTRLKLSKSAWYRHVAICRQAGLPVPPPAYFRQIKWPQEFYHND